MEDDILEKEIFKWMKEQFEVSPEELVEALKISPSAQGYIHGAISEIELSRYLENKGYEVRRIKEKPSGSYDNKKVGYKGDFLINKIGEEKYYVVECKGLKTNSEFRTSKTDGNYQKKLKRNTAFNQLKDFYNIDKEKKYNTGYSAYLKSKEKWENNNPGKKFPNFRWSKESPGSDSADITNYFSSIDELKDFVDKADEIKLTEAAFRKKTGLYLILQTHEPVNRVDEETKIEQAAPLVSDFSIMAVDLFRRTNKHEFAFMNPEKISHSPTSPNHIYQNYIIDILIPGKKEDLTISSPWYADIDKCIEETNPKTVDFDDTQLDHR